MSFLIGVSASITGYKSIISPDSPPKSGKYLFSRIYMSAVFLYYFSQF